MLYIYHRNRDTFDKIKAEKGDQILPTEMNEYEIKLYTANNQSQGSALSRESRLNESNESSVVNATIPEWKLMSATEQWALAGPKRSIRNPNRKRGKKMGPRRPRPTTA